MYFNTKNYLKNTYNHTVKHALNLRYHLRETIFRPNGSQRIKKIIKAHQNDKRAPGNVIFTWQAQAAKKIGRRHD